MFDQKLNLIDFDLTANEQTSTHVCICKQNK